MSAQTHNELLKEINNKANSIIKDFPDFIQRYFDHIDDKNYSKRTKLEYSYDIRKFLNYFDEVKSPADLDALTIDDLRKYIRTLNDNSPSYKARQIKVLKSLWTFLYKEEIITTMTASKLETPKINEHEIKTLDYEQVDRLLEEVSKKEDNISIRDKAIVTLFLGTGIRVSEMCGIDMNDIDFKNATILVHRKGGDTKSVRFGQEVEDALKEYIEISRPVLNKENLPALFIGKKFNRMTPRGMEKMLDKYKNQAGINVKITPHTLRRTFGTTVYNETGDIYLTATALNHANIDITRKYYAKQSDDKLREISKAASTLFKK